MFFSKLDLEGIKNKISLSSELEKKTRLVKKGKDYWCCCLFHQEKTPSMKINEELGSYYCFGCGAKGDIFNIYTDLYNYTFHDTVRELAQKTGVRLQKINYEQFEKTNNVKTCLVMFPDTSGASGTQISDTQIIIHFYPDGRFGGKTCKHLTDSRELGSPSYTKYF